MGAWKQAAKATRPIYRLELGDTRVVRPGSNPVSPWHLKWFKSGPSRMAGDGLTPEAPWDPTLGPRVCFTSTWELAPTRSKRRVRSGSLVMAQSPAICDVGVLVDLILLSPGTNYS